MSFAPSAQALKRIEGALSRYPKKDAALLPVLHIVQRETGHVPPEAEKWVADKLGIAPIRVREVLSFYTLLRTKPLGKYLIQVCRNLSCSLAGSADVVRALEEMLGIQEGQTTPDGKFTLETVECLGNCDHAPCLMINDEDHGPVTRGELDGILKKLE